MWYNHATSKDFPKYTFWLCKAIVEFMDWWLRLKFIALEREEYSFGIVTPSR